jgi:hypothetical protein
MHYVKHYSGMTPKVKDATAINDCIEYLGRDKWMKTFGTLVQPGASMAHTPYSQKKKTIQAIRFICMMAGIRDYPVRAIIRTVWAAHK